MQIRPFCQKSEAFSIAGPPGAGVKIRDELANRLNLSVKFSFLDWQ